MVMQADTPRDLQEMAEEAMRLGAAAAIVLPASVVVVDERVRLKCRVPRCPSFGRCANCPPHLPSLLEIRAALAAYNWVLVVRLEASLSDSGRQRHRLKPAIADDCVPWAGDVAGHGQLAQVVGRLETQALCQGHHLALGLGAGSCLYSLCDGEFCHALKDGGCRHPLKSRPSLEAMGIDVIDLIGKAGWPLSWRIDGPAAASASNVISAVGAVFVC